MVGRKPPRIRFLHLGRIAAIIMIQLTRCECLAEMAIISVRRNGNRNFDPAHSSYAAW